MKWLTGYERSVRVSFDRPADLEARTPTLLPDAGADIMDKEMEEEEGERGTENETTENADRKRDYGERGNENTTTENAEHKTKPMQLQNGIGT